MKLLRLFIKIGGLLVKLIREAKIFGPNLPQMARTTRRRLMKQLGPLIAELGAINKLIET